MANRWDLILGLKLGESLDIIRLNIELDALISDNNPDSNNVIETFIF